MAGAVNGLLAFARIMEGLQATQAGRPVAEACAASSTRAATRRPSPREDAGVRGPSENVEEFVSVAAEYENAPTEPTPDSYLQEICCTATATPWRHQLPAHAHDAAQGQGSRVPGGLQRRGVRRACSRTSASPGRTERGGGATARLRGHHARHGQAVPRACAREDALGGVAVQHAVTVPRRDPDRAHGAADHRRPLDQLGHRRRPRRWRQLGRRLVGSRRQRRRLERPRRAPRA